MSISTSVLSELLQAQPELRPQIYFKPSLTALSHAMEDQVLAGSDQPLVIANFQQERYYRQEAQRYGRIGKITPQVYVLAAAETKFNDVSGTCETVAFAPKDELSNEWHLVVVGQQYASCLLCRERETSVPEKVSLLDGDQYRRFEGVWTFNRAVSCTAAELLLDRILTYRPELAAKISMARSMLENTTVRSDWTNIDPGPFAERLMTYLQAGQYKLLQAYNAIAAQEQKERLVNSITDAIRRSLNPAEILQVAVSELGTALSTSRCLIYRCKASDKVATIRHEYVGLDDLPSLVGQTWQLQASPLFTEVLQQHSPVYVEDTATDPRLASNQQIASAIAKWKIKSWLFIPVLYKDQLLGAIELHHQNCHSWEKDELELATAIATQVGVALMQAQAYANLEDLNQQLEALDRTTRNLIAITGHELRTPLSTIQVCLESLASEPDMPLDMRQVMLNTALGDAERLREVIGDFLTLSRLESGSVEWNPEPLPLQECIDLAISNARSRQIAPQLPQITIELPPELPLVEVDGEWLVQVLCKLIDNAFKFTPPAGQVTIAAHRNAEQMVEVCICDTGRGIESDRLEAVFDRFYQEEGALRRTTGGTGLGLAICRQVVQNWGGQIWARSAGKDRGSQFHFTLPITETTADRKSNTPTQKSSQRRPTKRSSSRRRAPR
ncbi:MAG: DICT sensory domain-containing protein [Hormoscilla sp.]